MRKFLLILSVVLVTVALPARAAERSQLDNSMESDGAESSEGHSIGHRIFWYLPNRLLDVLDIVRLRVRVGPGLAVGVRATKVAQGFAGSYVSVYAGLPGPRMGVFPRLPIGLESHNGIDVSVVEASVSGGMNPDYSPTEFGAGAQLAIAGFDAGIDPYEILDLVVGFVGLDLRDDDL